MTDRIAQWEQTIREALPLSGRSLLHVQKGRKEALAALAALVAEANALRDVETAARDGRLYDFDDRVVWRAQKRLTKALARLDAVRAEKGRAVSNLPDNEMTAHSGRVMGAEAMAYIRAKDIGIKEINESHEALRAERDEYISRLTHTQAAARAEAAAAQMHYEARQRLEAERDALKERLARHENDDRLEELQMRLAQEHEQLAEAVRLLRECFALVERYEEQRGGLLLRPSAVRGQRVAQFLARLDGEACSCPDGADGNPCSRCGKPEAVES